MADDQYIVSGLWKDYASNKIYILVKEDTAVMVSNVVAVALTLSLPRLMVFIKLLAAFIEKKIQRRNQSDGRLHVHSQEERFRQQIVTPESPTLIELMSPQPAHGRPSNSAVPTGFIEELAHAVTTSHSVENAGGRIWRDYVFVNSAHAPSLTPMSNILARIRNFTRYFNDNRREVSISLILVVFFFSLFAGYQSIAICASRIVGPSIARSTNPYAGSWFSDILDAEHMLNTSLFPIVNDLHSSMAFKAKAYAEKCYEPDLPPRECATFYTPRIPYNESHNVSCPFQGDMCLEGPNSAYELDTGFLKATLLGINEEQTVHFRMWKICAPIVVDAYTKSTISDQTGSRHVEYFYGDGFGFTKQGNKTFGEDVKNPQSKPDDLPLYIIREIKGDTLQFPGQCSPRRWIPELSVLGSRVTLYFVRPVGLTYTQPSFDPIFPATISSWSMGNGNPLYTTPHQRSTVLGCADTIEIQHPISHNIWHPRYQNISQLDLPEWQHPSIASSLHIINMSYLQSEYFESRYVGMSEHFDAPRRIRSFYSSPLEREQWKLEVRKMFNMRLALLQYQVLGVAQGLGHDLPRARNLLDNYNVEASKKILFTENGWKNLEFGELMGFLGLCVGLWVTTIKTSDGDTTNSRQSTGDTLFVWWLVKDVIFNSIKTWITRMFIWVWKAEKYDFDGAIRRIDRKKRDLIARLRIRRGVVLE